MNLDIIGLGDINYQIAFYVEHTPPSVYYQHLSQIEPLQDQQIAWFGNEFGNGWRKQFNVYAKFIYQLAQPDLCNTKQIASWQAYRDSLLLKKNSGTALLFSPPNLENQHAIHIIAGRTYARQLISTHKITANLEWLNDEFAIDKANNLIVSPFLDYRQLSNIKIEKLVSLVTVLRQQNKT